MFKGEQQKIQHESFLTIVYGNVGSIFLDLPVLFYFPAMAEANYHFFH